VSDTQNNTTTLISQSSDEKPQKVGVPFFIVNGASGSGKTFLIDWLRVLQPSLIIFDIDNMVGNDWQAKKRNWLRVAHSIGLSGLPCVLCGTILPAQLRQCDYYNRFESIHVVNLHCDEKIRTERLTARGWKSEQIRAHIDLAQTFIELKDNGFAEPMTIINSDNDPQTAAQQLSSWITRHLEGFEKRNLMITQSNPTSSESSLGVIQTQPQK
jgi:hypothetical protein